MDKSHNSLLRELFVGSLNEADTSPESNYVQTTNICVKRALKSVRSLSAEAGHNMEEEVLKLDSTWKKRRSPASELICQKRSYSLVHTKIVCYLLFLFLFSD